VEALLAFAAMLVSLRLSADLARRYRERHDAALLIWAGALAAFAIGSGALAWGAAAGWSDPAFRVYYLFGGLLAAALLGAGSLARVGVRGISPLTLVYIGLAVGVAVAVPLTAPVAGGSIPEAQDHLALFPARVLGIRRRTLGNALILAGILVAALGSALAGLGEAESALFSLVAAVLLYGGFLAPNPSSEPVTDARPGSAGAAP